MRPDEVDEIMTRSLTIDMTFEEGAVLRAALGECVKRAVFIDLLKDVPNTAKMTLGELSDLDEKHGPAISAYLENEGKPIADLMQQIGEVQGMVSNDADKG